MGNSAEILLLGNDPADKQWSMLRYGEQLRREIDPLLAGRASVSLTAPDTRSLDGLRRWRAGRAAATYWSRYIAYPSLLRRRPPRGLVHILDQGNSWLIERLDPEKTIITCHDLIPLILRDRYRSLVPAFSSSTHTHIQSGLRRARFIIANSRCTREDVIRHLGYPPDRIEVIPLGIDSSLRPAADARESAAARESLGLPKEEQLLLHPSQNVFYKNIEGLLEEFALLIRRKRQVLLVRAGDPLSPQQRQLAARLGIAKQLVELGHLSPEKMVLFYRAGDALAYPSWYEGQGLPPLEAMASGLPVVVSNRGALPETVADAGLVIDPEQPGKLAETLERLLADETLRADLRRKGLLRAQAFSWAAAARSTVALYERIFSIR